MENFRIRTIPAFCVGLLGVIAWLLLLVHHQIYPGSLGPEYQLVKLPSFADIGLIYCVFFESQGQGWNKSIKLNSIGINMVSGLYTCFTLVNLFSIVHHSILYFSGYPHLFFFTFHLEACVYVYSESAILSTVVGAGMCVVRVFIPFAVYVKNGGIEEEDEPAPEEIFDV